MNIGSELNFQVGKFQKQIDARLQKLEKDNFVQRLWDRDASLWQKSKGGNEQPHPLGWLTVTEKMKEAVPAIEEFRDRVYAAGFRQVVLLGMGGSSLAPYVMQQTFHKSNVLRMIVLDSTDPETIRRIDNDLTIENTLFIVASKSGNTAEVMAFFHYFYARVYGLKGEKAGDNFVAITDEGSPLSKLAKSKKFREVFINFSDIGGRFSALSYFGMVPAALIGIDVAALLDRTSTMVDACRPGAPASQNPGVVLGAVLAEMALQGTDKLTYLMPPELAPFGLWLEQLIAESTGKSGKGILPLNGAPLLDIDTYGKDRCFFNFNFIHEPDYVLNQKLKDFTFLNYPLINIGIRDVLDIGREFYRWEVATAVAGSILGIDPFDQPNVEESKKCTTKLLGKLVQEGRLPEVSTSLIDSDLRFYGVPKATATGKLLEDFFSTPRPGDYVAILAYTPEDKETDKMLTELKSAVQRNLHVSVSTQYGPRYLHSTGQYHKGGPANGYFIQLVSNSNVDIKIPDQGYTFGQLKRAQAQGDMEALKKAKRKVLMVDLGDDPLSSMLKLRNMLESVHLPGKRERTAKENNPTAA